MGLREGKGVAQVRKGRREGGVQGGEGGSTGEEGAERRWGLGRGRG